MKNPFEWQDNCMLPPNNSEKKETEDMRAILFKKVLIKSVTILFSVLVWGQPALGCKDWQYGRACDFESPPSSTSISTFSPLP